jgi:hypothetical protein
LLAAGVFVGLSVAAGACFVAAAMVYQADRRGPGPDRRTEGESRG